MQTPLPHCFKQMKKNLMASFAVSFFLTAGAASAESIICSYEGYLNGGQVILDFKIHGDKATQGKWNEEYQVLQNNQFGVVLGRTMSEKGQIYDRPSVGGFFFAIDRASGAMTRNNVFTNDGDAFRKGKCIFR